MHRRSCKRHQSSRIKHRWDDQPLDPCPNRCHGRRWRFGHCSIWAYPRRRKSCPNAWALSSVRSRALARLELQWLKRRYKGFDHSSDAWRCVRVDHERSCWKRRRWFIPPFWTIGCECRPRGSCSIPEQTQRPLRWRDSRLHWPVNCAPRMINSPTRRELCLLYTKAINKLFNISL